MQQKIEAYFNKEKEAELIAAISRLVKIDSVAGEAKPGAPFGEGPARCLDEALKMAGEMGFATKNYDGYVGVADLNDKETELHMLGHMDIVGAGTGWTVTEPFAPKVVDGMLYGRGTDDDKGPMVCALFAMKAVRDLGVPLKKNARIIFGTDEETEMRDIAYYYAREPYAPCTFSPDADFPLIHIEKGHYHPVLTMRWEKTDALPRVSAVKGGFRINVVPPEADATVLGMDENTLKDCCAKAEKETGVSFTIAAVNGGHTIHANGTGGHAAYPEKANNALTALVALLASLPLADCGSARGLRALAKLLPHGDVYGKALGIAQQDELSGPLTASFNLFTLDETGFEGKIDSRTALCANDDNCRRMAEQTAQALGITCTGEMGAGHHTPAEAPFVQTLLKCYARYTGEKDPQPIAIGGGTYVHDIPGGVAFGCAMPGFVSNLHGPDEHACIQDLMTSCKIFTQAIIEICG